MVRSLVHRALERQRYRVIEASDGATARRICSQHEGPIDLVLTDVVMPGMTGRELYQRLAQVRPGLKVLFMSGYTENVIAHHGILEPGTAFVQKPFSVQDLLQRVGRRSTPRSNSLMA